MKRRAENGFTLLELLVALVMSATIAGSLAVSLYVAYRARAAAERAVDTAHVSDALGEVFARDLADALPPTGVLAGPFVGGSDSLGFFASGNEPRAAVQGDCRNIRYLLVEDEKRQGTAMLAREVESNLLAQVQEEAAPLPVFRDVESVSFLFFDGTNWLEGWDSTQNGGVLPVAVQITVVLRPRESGQEAQQLMRIVSLPCAVASAQSATGGVQ